MLSSKILDNGLIRFLDFPLNQVARNSWCFALNDLHSPCLVPCSAHTSVASPMLHFTPALHSSLAYEPGLSLANQCCECHHYGMIRHITAGVPCVV